MMTTQQQQSKNKFAVFVCVCVILMLLASNVAASNSRPPRNNDISNMADALKYLQDLDTYYGDRARVRFGKRAALAQLLRNRLTENGELTHQAEFSNGEEIF